MAEIKKAIAPAKVAEPVKEEVKAAAPKKAATKKAAAPKKEATKKAAAPKKEAAKKVAAPKKEATKKAAAPKKTAAKVVAKETVAIQFAGKDLSTESLIKLAKEDYKANKKKDVTLSCWISLFWIDVLPISKKRTNKATKCREEVIPMR